MSVRRLLLRHNLHGVFTTEQALRDCVDRLADESRCSPEIRAWMLLDEIGHNLRVGRIRGGVWTRDEVAQVLGWGAAPAASLARVLEELGVIEQAVGLIRSFGYGSADSSALATAAGEIRRRRATLGAELDGCIRLARGTFDRPDRRLREDLTVLHPFVEFHSAIRSGGFDVQRGPHNGS